MTKLPDWLVERVALDEVPPASRARVDGADDELVARVAALRDANAAELAKYPAAPALTQIEARVRANAATRRRRRLATLVGVIGTACVVLVAVRVIDRDASNPAAPTVVDAGSERVKGPARVIAYRKAGDHPELLDEDSLVKPGDVLQLRYKPAKAKYGLIASIDGAGEVTLHFPATEKGSTELSKTTTTLPESYALDDAPTFERFFIVTCDEPIDVVRTLNTLRSFAQRADSATAELALPDELDQWSLRLRKPEQAPK